MNLIVLDLEWNQASGTRSNPLVPFEIIEIGAVKVNSDWEIEDEFAGLVKPLLYPRLHFKVREMLGYNENYLKKGKPFYSVCREFLKWCGESYRFVTWGEPDLEQLQRNMEYYGVKKLPKPLLYYNLQAIYGRACGLSAACSLEEAAERFGIPADRPFHRAINDAWYTARILQAMGPEQVLDDYTFDTYNNPKNREEELRRQTGDLYQYISREFSDKRNVVRDKEVMAIHCPLCRARVGKKIKWFANNHSVYYCGGKCRSHGYFGGKMKFKSTLSGKVYIIKTLKLTDESGFRALRERQESLRIRRRERNKRQKMLEKKGSDN